MFFLNSNFKLWKSEFFIKFNCKFILTIVKNGLRPVKVHKRKPLQELLNKTIVIRL